MTQKSIIRLLAEIMAGTQVPRSLGPHMLGTATEPWDELRYRLRVDGWASADDIESALTLVLVEEITDDGEPTS